MQYCLRNQEDLNVCSSVIIIITRKRLHPDSIRIRIVAADSIHDSIPTKVSDSQVPTTCFSRSLFQLFVDHPLFLWPCTVHCSACLAMLSSFLLGVCTSQFHFLVLICMYYIFMYLDLLISWCCSITVVIIIIFGKKN